MTWPLGPRKPVGGGQGTFRCFSLMEIMPCGRKEGTETGKEGVKDKGRKKGRREGGRQERKKKKERNRPNRSFVCELST